VCDTAVEPEEVRTVRSDSACRWGRIAVSLPDRSDVRFVATKRYPTLGISVCYCEKEQGATLQI